MGAATATARPEHGVGDIQTLWCGCYNRATGAGHMTRLPPCYRCKTRTAPKLALSSRAVCSPQSAALDEAQDAENSTPRQFWVGFKEAQNARAIPLGQKDALLHGDAIAYLRSWQTFFNMLSHMMAVQGHDQLIDAVGVARNQMRDAPRVLNCTRHSERAPFVEIFLRVHDQESSAPKAGVGVECSGKIGESPHTIFVVRHLFYVDFKNRQ